MRIFIQGAVLAAATMLAAGAQAQTPPAAQSKAPVRQCFRTSQIDNYTSTDDEQTLYVRSGRNTFRIDFTNRCTGLAFRNSIVLKSVGDSNLVCTPLDLDFGVRDTGMYTRCIASAIHALTPEDVAALPKKLKP